MVSIRYYARVPSGDLFVKLFSIRYNKFMSANLLHEYIERISRLLDSEARLVGSECNLQPIQLNALYFLKHANRYSNTPQGVTDYLGLTKGTVSQTLTVLESKGFIKKTPDKKDGRVVHLDVTRPGKMLLEKAIPSPAIRRVWDGLEEQGQLVKGLQRFLAAMQKKNGMKAFGVCEACRFNNKLDETRFFCELTQENLSLKDSKLLCREFQSVDTDADCSSPE